MTIDVVHANKQAKNNPNEQGSFFMAPTMVGGIAIACGIINPVSALGYLAATVSGVAGSSFVYVLGEMAYERYNKWCHRVAAPLLINEKTPQYEHLLNDAFEQLKTHPHYNLFKKIRGGETDEQSLAFFKKNLLLGYCFGSVVNLLPILEEHPNTSCPDQLRLLDMKKVFYSQLVHLMCVNFQLAEVRVQREVQSAKAPSFSNMWRQMQNLPLEAEDPDKAVQVEKLEKQAAYLKQIITDIQSTFTPWEEIDSPIFPIKESSQAIRSNLEQILHSQMATDKTVTGRIILRGDAQDQQAKEYVGGHTIVFQFSPGRYRFYDTINGSDGGFYEYTDKREFYDALRAQLIDDLTQCKNPHIQGVLTKFF